MAFKKINAWFHLWLGLASGIIVFILSITGCILVFKQEIKSVSSPWLHAKKAYEDDKFLPPSMLYKSVQKTLPGKEVESIWYYGENRTAQLTIHESDSIVYVNPYTANVVAMVDHEDLFHFFEDGHYYFWLPEKIGHQVVGWGTFIFFLLLISGLILWWPKKWTKKTREQSFKIKWRAKFKRVNYDLHNVLGFYSIIIAIIMAFTALMMSFTWFNKGVYWMAGGEDKPRIQALSDTTSNPKSNMLVQVDKAWHKGINEIAEHERQDILMHFPEKASDPIYVCTDMYRGTWRDVYLDQHTLAELPASSKRLRDEDLASWIRRSNYGLHVGAFAGLTTKIIYFFASLICASLPVTGFYVWWGKEKKLLKRINSFRYSLKEKSMKTHVMGSLKLATGILLPFILLIFLIAFQTPCYAQTKGNISGKVVDAEGTPIEYVSVGLLYEDGKMVKGALSDSTGKFTFSAIPDGKYLVKISGVSYHPFTTQTFIISVENRILDLGLLKLKEDSKLLNAVVISAQKKLIEQTIDKTVINVESSILSEGSTALELLEKAPGVRVGEDGQISLKGRSGVLVMINGKSTYLSPKELSTLLKGTNSSSISRIEIMSNPSAKYDAAGNGGIINIQMKKNMKTGLNGSVTLNGGASRNARYGSALGLNYRNDKVNIYGSYDYAYRGETEYLDFVRRFYDTGNIGGIPSRSSYQDTETDEPLHTNNFRLGLDYELDSANTIGLLINGNVGKYTHDSKTGNRLFSGDGPIISHMATTNYDQQNWENLTYNVNYLHKFKKEGRTLSADADFASNSFTSKLNLKTIILQSADGQAGTTTNRRGYVPAVTDVYLAKVDYTDPLTKTIKLESGLKSSIIQSDNNLRYDLLNNGSWEYDNNGSNHFKYREQIQAGYLNINKEVKGFSVQAGLRGEYTRTQGHQITTDSLLTRSYFQLFPSVFVSKPMGANHLVQVAYSRRIERPDYGDLNPFRVFRDPLLFYQGNPFLKPELINAFQLSHSFKGKYTTAINYNQTTDVITWLSGQIDSLNTTFESPQNLSRLINYGVSFTASTTFFDWWNGTHFANIFRNEYKGNVQNNAFNNNTTSLSFNSQNSFNAGNGYTMELSGFYYSGSVYGISTYKGSYAISTGAQKTVLKDKGTIKLMINDIFQSDRYREQTKYQNIDMYTNKRPDSRRVMLSFSYRFGNQDLSKKDRKTGSEDIQNRVKGGG